MGRRRVVLDTGLDIDDVHQDLIFRREVALHCRGLEHVESAGGHEALSAPEAADQPCACDAATLTLNTSMAGALLTGVLNWMDPARKWGHAQQRPADDAVHVAVLGNREGDLVRLSENFVRPALPLLVSLTSALVACGSPQGLTPLRADLGHEANSAFPRPDRKAFVGLDESLDANLPMPAPAAVAQELWRNQWSRFLEDSVFWKRYTQDPDPKTFESSIAHKAAALCIEGPEVSAGLTFMYDRVWTYASAWGWAGEQTDQATANSRALAECEASKGKYGRPSCTCRLVADDRGLLTTVPTEWTPLVSTLQSDILERKRRRFFESATRIPLEHAELEAAIGFNRLWSVGDANSKLASFRLSHPRPIKIGYPDSVRDYSQGCWGRYSYALYLLPQADEVHFARAAAPLDDGHFYGCDSVTVDMKIDFHVRSLPFEWQCLYMNHLTRHDHPTDIDLMTLPSQWTATIQKANVDEVWIESAIQVSEDGLPLAKRELSRPVALRSGGRLWLAIEIVAPQPDGGCNVSYPFTGKVFDLTRCADRDDCAQRADVALRDGLRQLLAEAPYSAAPFVAGATPPGQSQYRRYDEPSLILGGAYYERTQYTAQTWAASSENPGDASYSRSTYLGLQHRAPGYLFLTFESVCTIAKNKQGPFRDDFTKDEQPLVDKALGAIVPEALQRACRTLAGKLVNGTCVL